MKSTWPGRIRAYSSGSGSFTLRIICDRAQTSSTPARVARSRAYSSSRMLLPCPAPRSTTTSVPGLDEGPDAGGRQGHPLLARLDLPRNADDHAACILPYERAAMLA